MRYRFLACLSILLFTTFFRSFGQANPKLFPYVGQPCPDIELNHIQYYSTDHARVSDFRGKWLILDFWHRWCSSCVESFPRTDSMQKAFKDKVQFILIGREDPENLIRTTYEKFRKHEHLDLPIIFDSTLHNTLDVSACPYIVLIDPAGIVQGITAELPASALEAFLDGKHPDLSPGYRDHHPMNYVYDPEKPLLVRNNGGADTSFFYRSLLCPWSLDMPLWNPADIDVALNLTHKKKFEVSFAMLFDLYNYAYFGRSRWQIGDSMDQTCHEFPILEMEGNPDSLKQTFFHNTYCYSLISPHLLTKEDVQKQLQEDLDRTFGYSAAIESRMLPCWVLRTKYNPNKKVLSLHEPVKGDLVPHIMLHIQNMPVLNLLGLIWGYYQTEAPFVDETGITGNISLHQDVLLTDMDAVKEKLLLYGLELVREPRLLKVLVIRSKPKRE